MATNSNLLLTPANGRNNPRSGPLTFTLDEPLMTTRLQIYTLLGDHVRKTWTRHSSCQITT